MKEGNAWATNSTRWQPLDKRWGEGSIIFDRGEGTRKGHYALPMILFGMIKQLLNDSKF